MQCVCARVLASTCGVDARVTLVSRCGGVALRTPSCAPYFDQALRSEGLLDPKFVDVFCEKGFFDYEQTAAIMKACGCGSVE